MVKPKNLSQNCFFDGIKRVKKKKALEFKSESVEN